MSDKYYGSFADSAFLQLLQDVIASIVQTGLEALFGTGVTPLRQVRVEVDPDDANAVPHHAVVFQPVTWPTVAVVVCAIKQNEYFQGTY